VRVFLAGATGAIGAPLLRLLVADGHEVTGMTRSAAKADALRAAGATPVVCDVFDEGLGDAIAAARPETLVHQLTDLPQVYDIRDYESFIGSTKRLREEGTPRLLEAAHAAGANHFVAQSVAFLYAPKGSWVKDETAAVVSGDGVIGPAMRATVAMEQSVLDAPQLDGAVLRYGFFYGPGTHYAADGSAAEQARKRQLPIVGRGTGVFSYVHVDDAASATVAAVERRATGLFNVCDDEPAPMREWVPAFAAAVGAPKPWRVPRFVARIFGGEVASFYATRLRGASNAKIKRELGWSPRYASWREGFREGL